MSDPIIPELEQVIEVRRNDLLERIAGLRFELRARLDPREYVRAHARAALLTALAVGFVAGFVWFRRR